MKHFSFNACQRENRDIDDRDDDHAEEHRIADLFCSGEHGMRSFLDRERASKLVLPGVGAFDAAMENLRSRGLIEALHKRVLGEGVPLFGICLGMQLLADYGEEGGADGLGWLPGRVQRLPSEGPAGPLRIPHIGWNTVEVRKHSLTTRACSRMAFWSRRAPGVKSLTTTANSPLG